MRELLELFTIFDWITPSIGFVQDFINDKTLMQKHSWTFFIDYDLALSAGWNPNNIEGLLKQHGVKTWGGQLTNGEFFFSVKIDQAQWSEFLMGRNGIPIKELSMGAPKPKGKNNQGAEWSDSAQNVVDLVNRYF